MMTSVFVSVRKRLPLVDVFLSPPGKSGIMHRILRRCGYAAIFVLMLTARGESLTWPSAEDLVSVLTPTWPEYGFLSGMTNVYTQMEQFARSMTQINKNIKTGRMQLARVAQKLGVLYETLTELKNIDIYDKETWTTAVSDTRWFVSNGLGGAIHLYEGAEHVLLDGDVQYFDNIKTDTAYDDVLRRNSLKVSDLYFSQRYNKLLKDLRGGRDYALFRKDYVAVQDQLDTEVDLEKARNFRMSPNATSEGDVSRYDNLSKKRRDLADSLLKRTDGNEFNTKTDSLMYEIRSLLAVNIAEIGFAESRLWAMEETIGDLMGSYFDLVNGNVRTTIMKVDRDIYVPPPKDLDSIYHDIHPDKVPFPSLPPSSPKYSNMHKKNPDVQDALSLQNDINFLTSKQDALYRDIAAMKVNSMAFIVALEAMKQHTLEEQGFRSTAVYKKLNDEWE